MGDIADDFMTLSDMEEADMDAMFKREQKWREGIHITRDGTKMRIKDMTADHLCNTIRYFEGYDTSPLEEDLSKR
jgi:hypothetical protein